MINTDRPTWDEYFINLAQVVSSRSEDSFIKHGAVIVDKNKHIVSTGYNGLVAHSINGIIDMSDRDERRPFMVHAETNAILNCKNQSSDNLTIYVTGEPCNPCLLNMINFGIVNIKYLDRIGSITFSEKEKEQRSNILKMRPDVILEKINLGLKNQ